MKYLRYFLNLYLLFAINGYLTACEVNEFPAEEQDNVSGHPRLLLLKGEEAAIKQNIAADRIWGSINVFILEESSKMLTKPPVERVLIGRRLLDKSREALKRIFYLSYSYRMTSDKKYLDRAEKEMLAVADFIDWNPSHFLDVAEMTMGMAIGYDWLFSELSPESRARIKNAIVEKGLKPSLESKNNGWLKASHNWNQVCNAGMTFGAIAVMDQEKELAELIIKRAAESILLPMNDYQPDGAYSEGYSYWGYGTSFNVLYLSAVEKLFGEASVPRLNEGFLKTAGYLNNMTGPTGIPFNYSDCGSSAGMQPAMFWFANRIGDPSVLWMQKYFLESRKPSSDRILPAVMVWGAGLSLEEVEAPSSRIWAGQGRNPVALLRSGWEGDNLVFAGLKAGSPSVNHGHMDVGSFVMDALGERWAMDFGSQDYNSLETAGVNLWSMTQNSERWQVFRYNNFVHNTLTVNNQLQAVNGKASITSHSASPGMINAITDITAVYTPYLKKARRGLAIAGDKYVMVRDEIENGESESVIRWTLLTSAEVTITGNNSATLQKNGKKVFIKVISPVPVEMKTWSTEPANSFDAPNPGTIRTGFEFRLNPLEKSSVTVLLLPEGSEENSQTTLLELDKWPH